MRLTLQEEFKDLLAWWKEVLGSEANAVKVSNRLATSPAMVVTAKFGWGANMERIMKAQVCPADWFSASLSPRLAGCSAPCLIQGLMELHMTL